LNLEEKRIKSEYLYKGKIVNLRRDTVRLPNGADATREIVEHGGAAAVLPVTQAGEVIFVKQYRCPFERVLLEIPAGKLDPGEQPTHCAERELLEETGSKAEKMTFLCEIYPSPGCYTEILYLYAAEGLSYYEASPDEDEFLQVQRIPLEDALKMVNNGEIKDAKTITALLLYERLKSQNGEL
jgi:hypothetical protein